jgi:hypothetical protein
MKSRSLQSGPGWGASTQKRSGRRETPKPALVQPTNLRGGHVRKQRASQNHRRQSLVETLLYTDFPLAGEIRNPNAAELAEHAIRNVEAAKPGMDGVSYLIAAINSGIQTPLTSAYREEILRRTKTDSLNNALDVARSKSPQPKATDDD